MMNLKPFIIESAISDRLNRLHNSEGVSHADSIEVFVVGTGLHRGGSRLG
jgi:hypothetical protein